MFTGLFDVLPMPHSRGPRTDFHAQYVERRGFAQGRAFSGLENKYSTFKPFFPKKIRYFGPDVDGTVVVMWGSEILIIATLISETISN